MATASGEARGGEYGWQGGEQVSEEQAAEAARLSEGLELSLEDPTLADARVKEGRFEQSAADRIINTVMDNGPTAPEVVAPKETREEKDNKMRVHLLEKSIQLRLAGDIEGADKADAMLKTFEDTRK